MTPPAPESMHLAPSADRALAALETTSGKSRVQQYLARVAAQDGKPELSVDDLVRALQELRRRP